MTIYALHFGKETEYYEKRSDAMEDGISYALEIGPHICGSFLDRLVSVKHNVVYIETCPTVYRAVARVEPIVLHNRTIREES